MRVTGEPVDPSTQGGPSRSEVARPSVWAWALESWLDTSGNEVAHRTADALRVVAICVSSFFPTTTDERLRLMRAVAVQLGDAGGQHDSLWVYPAGMFGFDASRYDTGNCWDGVQILLAAQHAEVVAAHPPRSVIVFGSDHTGAAQTAVVCHGDGPSHSITRGVSPANDRVISIGSHRVFVLVCGEIVGSYDQGPCWPGHYFDGNEPELSQCGLLVDLSHSYVRRYDNPRAAHQNRMIALSSRMTAALTHHHNNEATMLGATRFDCRSDWVLFRGGRWASRRPTPICMPTGTAE